MNATERPITEQDDRLRQFYVVHRECILKDLGAVEDFLGMERSVVPRKSREGRVSTVLGFLRPGWQATEPELLERLIDILYAPNRQTTSWQTKRLDIN